MPVLLKFISKNYLRLNKNLIKMTEEKEYMELRMMGERIQQLQEYLQQIEKQMEEVHSIIHSIEDFSKVKKGTKILVPIANGIFAPATLESSKTVKLNVGSGMVVDKTLPQVKQLLEKQDKEMHDAHQEAVGQFQEMISEFEGRQETFEKKYVKKDE